ncbi:MAG: shikimate kinase [Alphaproteobacteria bacterium]|nr:shikimate kinase [Alphaproteobacteria bacterium]MCL2504754.1 shikimate kinase [Alphaproteobacteria bacterium]
MRCFGLLGERLSHSYSPLIHAELGDYEYKLYEKKPEELEKFLMHGDFEGLNITIPYKTAVIPFCAGLSETAKAICSVNTITRLADGSLYGDTTDYFGFSYLLKKTGVDPAAGKIIILGSGGSSCTVQAVLRNAKAGEIVVVSRSGASNYENIEKHKDAIMIVNTTPLGMYPNNGVSPVPNLDIFQNCRAVIDLIYNPLRTELLLQAEERGILCIGGLAMLAAQAKKSAEQFLHTSIPDEKIEEITAKIARLTRNIILIGMPGCGKSSIGAALAKSMGREFADTDDWIVKTAGKSIPAIFAEDGEEAFRKLETDALKTLCKQSGLVIAAGGGIVTRHENRNTIRQNGIVVFLDRAINELPTAGRPLSESEGVGVLAKARLPLYTQWSDYTVPVHGVEQTAAGIFEQLSG